MFLQVSQAAADVLRGAYEQAMRERREVVDVGVLKEAAAVVRGVLLEGVSSAAAGVGDAPELREARWAVRRSATFLPGDPVWSAGVVEVLPEVVRRVRGEPYTPLLPALGPLGVLQGRSAVGRWASGVLGRMLLRSRRAGGPVLAALEMEASRQAVLLGRPVDTAAVVLAVLSLDEQLTAGGQQLRERYRAANEGGAVLRARGVTLAGAQAGAPAVRAEQGPADRRLTWGHTPADPDWTEAAARVWDAALELAAGRDAGTSHLVQALGRVDAPAAAELLG
ncbi:hypothetical protein [Actinoplanes sp. N902-109]|uniref:hypothetical protein n=1 Tax=Actinoplanes sp. (strain N902-109) TaxID=649831 RepID=UPI00032964B8|nr:hypothetical protein [Actinoplanes sp. N902-109]AGL17309.1 Clp domain-containing protein [Actinoplanes sp. N902-109]